MKKEERFGFGQNWKEYLQLFSEERLQEAEKSLKEKLGCKDLKGLTFLDVGCGSGLFSLAAYRMGAQVTSFDYDENSVACSEFLKKKFSIPSEKWKIFQGSVLDEVLIKKLGKFDIVYSWGVLHHTGKMRKAFDLVSTLVKEKGTLFISIYNDQGLESKVWKKLKKLYVTSGSVVRFFVFMYTFFRNWTITLILDTIRFRRPLKSWKSYGENRGMSPFYDLIDWAGGYPFEVAKPEEVFHYFHEKGFNLEKLKTCGGGLGCNEFVFTNKT